MIKKHGSTVIDLKKDFKIPRESGKTGYSMEIYFFIPSNLNTSNFGQNEFFSDLNFFTRYNSPNLNIETLYNLSKPNNPLHILNNLIEQNQDYLKIEYELKTLYNAMKSETNNIVDRLDAIEAFSSFEAGENLEIQINRISTILNSLLQLYRKSPENCREIFQLTIEGISLNIEKTLYLLYKKIPQRKDLIIDEIKSQIKIRSSLGLRSIASENEDDNNTLIYREHLIKKWAENIMYITVEDSMAQKNINHVFLGTAAALAMLIAVTITIFSTKIFGENSIYWVFVAVLAYSLKDRTKEVLKAIFLRRATTIFSDRIKNIISPGTGLRCGKSTESLSFPRFKLLQRDVKNLRYKFRDDLDIKQHSEDIIKYTRTVHLDTKQLYKGHSRLFGIKEIMRFDLRRWFYKMDNITEKCYIPRDGRLVSVKGEREYRFCVIVRTTTEDGSELKRYRINANRKGIQKVYEIS